MNGNKIKQIALSLVMVMILTACGGGGGSTPPPESAKFIAMNSIKAYAENGSSDAPTVQTYIDAGVQGVTNDNLAALNSLVDGLEAEDVDTVEEINALTATLGVNIIPVAHAQTVILAEDSSKAITLTATDAEGNTLTYMVVTLPIHGTLSGTAPNLTYTPSSDFFGIDDFEFLVNDGSLDSVKVKVKIVVENVSESKAQLKGNLIDAEAKIYQIEDNADKTLLFTETTDKKGQFNSHSRELIADKFYIYQISGGVDTNNSTTNNGIIRAIVKGSFAKNNDFVVSIASEMAYIFLAKDVKYAYSASKVEQRLHSVAKTIFSFDINEDNNISNNDILKFEYQKNKNAINSVRYTDSELEKMFVDIYDGTFRYGESVLSTTIGSYSTNDYSFGMVLSKDKTKSYVAGGDDGLIILDISDITKPIVLGTYKTTSYVQKVVLSKNENIAYILNQEEGFLTLDISDKSNPKLLGSYSTYTNSEDITLSNDETKAFISEDRRNGILILDISDKTNLSYIGRISTSSRAKSIVLSNDEQQAYISNYLDGLVVVDISDIRDTKSLGTYYSSNSSIYQVVLNKSNTRAYVHDGNNGLIILDISNPSSLREVSRASIANGFEDGRIALSSDESKIYFSNGSSEFQILDISNENNITTLETFNTDGSVHDIFFSADAKIAYIGNSIGLVIIDIENVIPANYLNSLPTNGWSSDNITLSKNNDIVYIGNFPNYIDMIDISDTNNIKLINSYNKSGIPFDIKLSNDESKIFVAYAHGGFSIIDIEDKDNPSEIGLYSGYYNAIAISDDESKAFLLDNSKELTIVDISDEKNITYISGLSIEGYVEDIVLSKDEKKVYIVDGDGLVIIDITDISNPIKLGRINISEGSLNNIVLSRDEQIAFIDDYKKGLFIIDISDSQNPTLINTFPTEILNFKLSNDEDKIYIAGRSKGLIVIDISNVHNIIQLVSFKTQGAVDVALSEDESLAYIADRNIGLVIIDLLLFNRILD